MARDKEERRKAYKAKYMLSYGEHFTNYFGEHWVHLNGSMKLLKDLTKHNTKSINVAKDHGPVANKLCSKCKTWHPASAFAKSTKYADGLQYACLKGVTAYKGALNERHG